MESRKKTGFTLNEFINSPGMILALAGVLAVIGSIGTWWSTAFFSTYGIDTAAGKGVFFMGLLMLYSSASNLGYTDFFSELVPIRTISSVSGVTSFIIAADSIIGPGSDAWGLYLVLISSVIAMFAAFLSFQEADWASGRGSGL